MDYAERETSTLKQDSKRCSLITFISDQVVNVQ